MSKQVVLLTGASRGIGRVTSHQLSFLGYKTYAGARNTGSIEKRENLIPIYIDLMKEETLINAVDQIIQKEGKIDILYHIAGEAYYSPVEAMDLEETKNMYEVNLFGPFRLTQLVLPFMRKQKKGHIIFTSSVRASAPCVFMGMYSGSKAALELLAWDLKNSLMSWNIDVTVVQPGPVNSGILIKSGSRSSIAGLYPLPENEDLEWQDLNDVGKFMSDIVHQKQRNFRYQTSTFAEKMIQQFKWNTEDTVVDASIKF